MTRPAVHDKTYLRKLARTENLDKLEKILGRTRESIRSSLNKYKIIYLFWCTHGEHDARSDERYGGTQICINCIGEHKEQKKAEEAKRGIVHDLSREPLPKPLMAPRFSLGEFNAGEK